MTKSRAGPPIPENTTPAPTPQPERMTDASRLAHFEYQLSYPAINWSRGWLNEVVVELASIARHQMERAESAEQKLDAIRKVLE